MNYLSRFRKPLVGFHISAVLFIRLKKFILNLEGGAKILNIDLILKSFIFVKNIQK